MRQFFSWGCTHCGASFTTRYKRARKFCSLQCQGASRKLTDEEYKKGLVKRFWGFVDVRSPEECWNWKGSTAKGYGKTGSGKRTMYAHRLAWELTHCQKLGSLLACHHCDNPLCCNPAHIYAGTPLSNAQDMDARGRRVPPKPVGERNPRALITEADVIAIRKSSATPLEIATTYSISRNQVYRIRSGLAWKHVGDKQ